MNDLIEQEGWSVRRPISLPDALVSVVVLAWTDLDVKEAIATKGPSKRFTDSARGGLPGLQITTPLREGWDVDLLRFLREHDPDAPATEVIGSSSNVQDGHVFVSYSRKDQSYVDRLVEHLDNAGLTTWIDREGIRSGSKWTRAIAEAIDGCSAFVVVMSAHSEASDEVELELLRAQKKRKPIFPLLLDGDGFFRLEATQRDDVTDGSMPSERTLDEIRRLVGLDQN